VGASAVAALLAVVGGRLAGRTLTVEDLLGKLRGLFGVFRLLCPQTKAPV
jgi:hypothetical protein